MSFPWPYRRIAAEEAFSVPEVHEALRGWAASTDPAEPDQDFWDFVFTQDTPGLRRVRRQLLDLAGERLEIIGFQAEAGLHALRLICAASSTGSRGCGSCWAIMFAIDYPYQSTEERIFGIPACESADLS
jgi:hypothetical protein